MIYIGAIHNDLVLNELNVVIFDGFRFFLDVMKLCKLCSRILLNLINFKAHHLFNT